MKKTSRKRLTLTKDTLARVTGGAVVAVTAGCTVINSAVIACYPTLKVSCIPATCQPAGTSHCTISIPGTGG